MGLVKLSTAEAEDALNAVALDVDFHVLTPFAVPVDALPTRGSSKVKAAELGEASGAG